MLDDAAVCQPASATICIVGAVLITSQCLQEQEKKQRIRGIDAQKNNIQAAKAITRILKTSLGPKGMDKMLQGPDGDVCISESMEL